MGAATDSPLMAELSGVRGEVRPVWFMRQAGRSLPEYRAIREGYEMLEACLTPDVAAEITLQPVRRHGVDAAVFFSDIVVPLALAGIPVEIQAGVGPVLDSPIRSAKDLDRLNPLDPVALDPVKQAAAQVVAELGETPLIAFGGAPFTLASYLIEGGPSRDLPHSWTLMKQDPETWSAVLEWCAEITADFIAAQVHAGAAVLQVFDSWAGKLSAVDYRRWAKPYSAQLFAALDTRLGDINPAVPRIHFGLGTGEILPDMYEVGATAIGVDHTLTLSEANQLLGGVVPLQGNIHVDQLQAPWPELRAHIDAVLESGQTAPGHVVNLSHGVPKDTDPDVLTRIVDYVHEVGR